MSETRTTAELWRDYVRAASEAAFAEIVARQIDLVYSVALRKTAGDAHTAQDITQIVFCDLARKARRIPRDTVLAGWLYRHTCFTAAKTVRTNARRRARETEVTKMNLTQPEDEPSWDRIAPFIEELTNRLGTRERDALTLRFFQCQSYSEVAAELATTEEAARKLVSRALGKLRLLLEKRGVTGTSAGLMAALSGGAAVPAPSGLATAVSSLASAATTLSAPLLLAIMTKLKIAAVAGLLVAGASLPVWQRYQIQKLREQNSALRQQLTGDAHDRRQIAASQPLALGQRNGDGEPRKEFLELLRLRGQLGVLRAKASKHAPPQSVEVANPALPDTPEAKTPGPARALTASGSARVASGQTLITGGWLTSSGNRLFVFVTPSLKPGDPASGVLEGRFVEMTREAASQTGLDQLGVNGAESDLAGLYDEDQWRIASDALKTMEGVRTIARPRLLAPDGIESEFAIKSYNGAGDNYSFKIVHQTVTGGGAVDLYFRANVDSPAVSAAPPPAPVSTPAQ